MKFYEPIRILLIVVPVLVVTIITLLPCTVLSFSRNTQSATTNVQQHLSFGYNIQVLGSKTRSNTYLSMVDKSNKESSSIDDALQQFRNRFTSGEAGATGSTGSTDGDTSSNNSNKFDFASAFKNPLSSSEGKSNSKSNNDSTNNENTMIDDTMSSITKRVEDFDVSTITSSLLSIKDNVLNGEFGTRGEIYFIAQFVTFIFIVVGGIPIIGNPIEIIIGPLLVVSGIGTIVLGINDLGVENLSPWPKPVDTNDSLLQTNGIYQYIRHPMYSGLLLFSVGLGIVSDSTSRLVLTCILYYILDKKSTYEEEQLLLKYKNDYSNYQQNTSGKFIPNELLNDIISNLPINK